MTVAWDFIERAGRELGATEEALRKWRVRGVPARLRLDIVDMARAEGIDIDRRAFDEPPGPRSRPDPFVEAAGTG